LEGNSSNQLDFEVNMISKKISILLLIQVLISNIYAAEFAPPSRTEKGIGYISFLLGAPSDILIKHRGYNGWDTARLQSPIRNGDIIRTEKESRCEIKLNDGSIIRIGEATTFDFTDAKITSSERKVSTKLIQGQIWVNLKKFFSKKDGFRILAPTAVCAVRGTIYRVDADTTTHIAVYDGEVDVGPTSFWGQWQQPKLKSLEPKEIPGPQEIPGPYEVSLEEWVCIIKGFQIEVRADSKIAKSRIDGDKDARDEWVRWNHERDRLGGGR